MPTRKPVQWQKESSYAKSADTRRAILDAALAAFGEAGFNAVTTRHIAERAQVNQPAIAYYFKNKQGLYLACAQEIVDRSVGHTAQAGLIAAKALERGADPNKARALLKDLLAALADLLVNSDDMAAFAGFVEREMREQGLAYNLIYESFWGPGVDLVAQLVAAARKLPAPDQNCRVEAIMLITSLLAFASGSPLLLQAMGWEGIGSTEKALVLTTLNQRIEAIKP